MKSLRSLMSSAAVVAVATSRVLAADLPAEERFAPPLEPQMSGIVDVYAAFVDGEGDGRENDWFAFGGGGHVNIPFGPNWGLQLDAIGEAGTDTDEDDEYGGFGPAAHVYWRDPNSWAFGMVGAVQVNTANSDSAIHGLIGAEAATYFGMFTLLGQIGYLDTLDTDGGFDGPEDTWFVRGVGRWFPMPTAKVEVGAGYFSGDFDSGDNFDGWNVGVEGEIMLGARPISVYAAYDGYFYEDDWDDFDSHTIMAGVRFYLNQPDLLTNDRYGPSFDLPSVTRYSAIMEALN